MYGKLLYNKEKRGIFLFLLQFIYTVVSVQDEHHFSAGISLVNAIGLAVHKQVYPFQEEGFQLVAKPLLHQ